MVSFGTAGIRGDIEKTVTPAVALAVGRALSTMTETVVIGRDCRLSSPALTHAIEAGALSGGSKIVNVGQVPTPALAWASRDCVGVMITASHNPASDNGIKLFIEGEEFDRARERLIESAIAKDVPPVKWHGWQERRRKHILDEYRQFLLSYLAPFGDDPGEMVVGIDCGNGVGGLVTPPLLSDMGVSVKSFNVAPDGRFPARSSKPTARSLAVFADCIADSDIELGLAHDGDADRLVVLDDRGEIVHEDTILAIIAHHYVTQSDVSKPIVITTPNASARVDERVSEAGGRVERTRLGGLHEGIAEAHENNRGSVVFAAEPWKHIHPMLGGWIDGIASAGLIVRLIAASGSLSTLREPISERPYKKVSVRCADEHKRTVLELLTERLQVEFPDSTVDTSYGLRLSWPDGSWVLLRPSGTEPKFRIYLEAPTLEPRLSDIIAIVEEAVAEASC